MRKSLGFPDIILKDFPLLGVSPSYYQGWNMSALHSLAWGNTARHKIMPGSLQRQVSPGFIPLSWQMSLKLSEKNTKNHDVFILHN